MRHIQNAFLKQEFNNGQLNLIAIHGVLGSKANFKNLVKSTHISKLLQSAYLIDVRNHGDSPHAETMTYEEMANDLRHFIREHSITNPVLMGHSMGGRIIFQYLQSYPTDPIKGNIIVDISPCEGEGNNFVEAIRNIDLKNKTLGEIENAILEVCKRKDQANLIMTNLTYEEKEVKQPCYKWKINMSVISEFMRRGHAAFSSQYQGTGVIICGEDSEYVKQTDRPLFTKVFPNLDPASDIYFIKGAGHWVQVDKPREFLLLVSNYLAKLHKSL